MYLKGLRHRPLSPQDQKANLLDLEDLVRRVLEAMLEGLADALRDAFTGDHMSDPEDLRSQLEEVEYRRDLEELHQHLEASTKGGREDVLGRYAWMEEFRQQITTRGGPGSGPREGNQNARKHPREEGTQGQARRGAPLGNDNARKYPEGLEHLVAQARRREPADTATVERWRKLVAELEDAKKKKGSQWTPKDEENLQAARRILQGMEGRKPKDPPREPPPEKPDDRKPPADKKKPGPYSWDPKKVSAEHHERIALMSNALFGDPPKNFYKEQHNRKPTRREIEQYNWWLMDALRLEMAGKPGDWKKAKRPAWMQDNVATQIDANPFQVLVELGKEYARKEPGGWTNVLTAIFDRNRSVLKPQDPLPPGFPKD